MDRTRSNFAYRELHSKRRLGPLIIFMKRCIRKCLKWYIDPICFQQTEFNNAVTPAIGRLTQSVTQLYHASTVTPSNDRYTEVVASVGQLQNQFGAHIDKANGDFNNLAKQLESLEQVLQSINARLQKSEEQLDIQERWNSQIELRIEQQGIRLEQQGNRLEMQSAKLDQQVTRLETQTNSLSQINSKVDDISRDITANQAITAEKNSNLTLELDTLRCQLKSITAGFNRIEEIHEREFNPWDKRTTSQAGEDSILLYLLPHFRKPFSECSYLDLGANHAIELSNTFALYQLGARGVLVEANPQLIAELKERRKGDLVLHRCISSSSGTLQNFYIMNGDGLSCTSLEAAQLAIQKNPALEIENIVTVESITVNDILQQYFKEAPTVVNIDVEGMELDILHAWNFDRYRPYIFIIEVIPYKPTLVVGEKDDNIIQYMKSVHYIEYAFTGINSIFIDEKYFKERES